MLFSETAVKIEIKVKLSIFENIKSVKLKKALNCGKNNKNRFTQNFQSKFLRKLRFSFFTLVTFKVVKNSLFFKQKPSRAGAYSKKIEDALKPWFLATFFFE